MPAWINSPLELFDFENLNHRLWEDIHHAMQEIPASASVPKDGTVSFLAGTEHHEIWPLRVDQLVCGRAGEMFEGPVWVDPDNPPEVPWLEISEHR